ncbi:FAD dependent oxidoreductase [Rhodotorula diobovata]|uniref:FAD dependent oxidoreductase n=1 Tax=Rhodotorula diobovata TaxID=5288 RepID=A0A5C5G5B0_9BASI|nr:FAD dependent oxidoreductase [Rhodotorula diobovata]
MAPVQHPHPLPSPVIIVGAGCIGLATAVELLKRSWPVLLLAHHLPGDPLAAEYASSAAGAHHLSFAASDDWRQRYLDMVTFERLWEESEIRVEGEERGVMRLTQTEYYKGDLHLRLLEELPDFRIHDATTLPDGVEHAVSFSSLTIEPARYLPYLVRVFTSLGGIMQRVPRLNSLAEALRYAESPLAVVNCSGLGARDLAETQDKTVHPVRGQVLSVRAPWIKTGWTRQVGALGGAEGGERTYVIPRASGEVIIGGTREVDDWETQPREETTRDILRRALEICPALALPPHATEPVELAELVTGAVVGFRPTRDGGIRLEAETLKLDAGEDLTVVHCYGHGGFGWQSMWGSAEETARIVGEEVRKKQKGAAATLLKARL